MDSVWSTHSYHSNTGDSFLKKIDRYFTSMPDTPEDVKNAAYRAMYELSRDRHLQEIGINTLSLQDYHEKLEQKVCQVRATHTKLQETTAVISLLFFYLNYDEKSSEDPSLEDFKKHFDFIRTLWKHPEQIGPAVDASLTRYMEQFFILFDTSFPDQEMTSLLELMKQLCKDVADKNLQKRLPLLCEKILRGLYSIQKIFPVFDKYSSASKALQPMELAEKRSVK